MAARNQLLMSPPHAVEIALRRLGTDLRTARTRRNLTVAEVAEKIGTGPRVILDAEKGKPSSSAAAYVALLWVYGLLDQMDTVADPTHDERGRSLALAREKKRPRQRKGLSDDF
ncbi:helix-turn-helix transcriptional regulator [Magnetospirillum sp. 15-1]|uniref:helix-turn-helix domain-containing protein n=1 Tax=Magnetospirillum sp. 15-1 TaxID=1979370 RepID=UPI000BBBC258|nr:helix-turn-helix transcriptional regulator [Magnetospirillum sp. 15-1]